MSRKIVLYICLIFLFVPQMLIAKKLEEQDQLQLQESVQRFYTRFTERILAGFLVNRGKVDVNTKEEGIRQYMLYDSEALKIATGPYPEVNLLDMLVFIKLNKMTVKNYWIEQKWKSKGDLILQAFEDSERDIDQIAGTILTPEQMAKINNGVVDWINMHPNQFRVEKIRMNEFAKVASLSAEVKDKGAGIFNIKGAVKAVDQMVLVANRGIFMAQYLPLIMRLHARLGVSEIVDDLSLRFNQLPLDRKIGRSVASVGSLSPMLDSAVELTGDMKVLSKDAHGLLNSYHQVFPNGINATENLKMIQSIVVETNDLVDEMKSSNNLNFSVFEKVKSEFKSMAFFIAFLVLGVGMLCSLFFWGCYYFFRIRLKQTREVA